MGSDRRQEDWLALVNDFVQAYRKGLETAKRLQEASRPPGAPPERPEGRPLVLICAPHPDDEMLTGSLALRLHHQGAAVEVLALTMGSDPARKAQRRGELQAACQVAGFAWRPVVEPLGFPVLRPEQVNRPAEWRRMRKELTEHLARAMPALVLVPHALDGHPVHRTANRLVVQALKAHSRTHRCRVLLAETEYWRPLAAPNLLLGVPPGDLAVLLEALACHQGEMARHPYHLRQPARMMDNVRRGAELVAGFGEKSPDFPFAELYRLSRVDQGRLSPLPQPRGVSPEAELGFADLAAWFDPQPADR